jgi:hypothetical protein
MINPQQIFNLATVDGRDLYLPDIELDRDLFVEVKKQITLAGGKWQGGKYC